MLLFVCVGDQLKDGVTFITLTTPYFLNNMARANNCGFRTQGHFDRVFDKDFALIAFGMNSMGAHYNPVSISIVDSESKIALDTSYNAMCAGLYAMYNTVCLCGKESCGF